MDFLLKFSVEQVNMVIKGLESLRDTSTSVIQDITRQIQSQVNPPQAPAPVTPDVIAPASDMTTDSAAPASEA